MQASSECSLFPNNTSEVYESQGEFSLNVLLDEICRLCHDDDTTGSNITGAKDEPNEHFVLTHESKEHPPPANLSHFTKPSNSATDSPLILQQSLGFADEGGNGSVSVYTSSKALNPHQLLVEYMTRLFALPTSSLETIHSVFTACYGDVLHKGSAYPAAYPLTSDAILPLDSETLNTLVDRIIAEGSRTPGQTESDRINDFLDDIVKVTIARNTNYTVALCERLALLLLSKGNRFATYVLNKWKELLNCSSGTYNLIQKLDFDETENKDESCAPSFETMSTTAEIVEVSSSDAIYEPTTGAQADDDQPTNTASVNLNDVRSEPLALGPGVLCVTKPAVCLRLLAASSAGGNMDNVSSVIQFAVDQCGFQKDQLEKLLFYRGDSILKPNKSQELSDLHHPALLASRTKTAGTGQANQEPFVGEMSLYRTEYCEGDKLSPEGANVRQNSLLSVLANIQSDPQLTTEKVNGHIKAFCLHSAFQDAWDVYSVAVENKQISPDAQTFGPLLNIAIQNPARPNHALMVLREVQKHRPQVTSFVVDLLAKTLRNSASMAVREAAVLCVEALGIIACKESVLLGPLLDFCIRRQDKKRMHRLMQQFKNKSADGWIDLKTYGLLLRAAGLLGSVEDCGLVWEHMGHRGMEPNEVTYGCYLDALVSNECTNEALIVLNKMRAVHGVKPNTIMYSTVIKGLARTKQLEEALSLYEAMKADGVEINTITYNSLIDSCARSGDIDKAVEILDEMIAGGVSPDLITFSTLVKGYCLKGDMARSVQLLSAMKDSGIYPDGILYNSLLDGCVRAGHVALCEELWEEMRRSAIRPTNFTLTILVKLYGRMGRLDDAFRVVETIPSEHNFELNAHVYTCLMSASLANGEPQRALRVFQQMKDDGIDADKRTYETLCTGMLRYGRLVEAAQLIQEALDRRALLPHSRGGWCGGREVGMNVINRFLSETRTAGCYEELAAPLVTKYRLQCANTRRSGFTCVNTQNYGTRENRVKFDNRVPR